MSSVLLVLGLVPPAPRVYLYQETFHFGVTQGGLIILRNICCTNGSCTQDDFKLSLVWVLYSHPGIVSKLCPSSLLGC